MNNSVVSEQAYEIVDYLIRKQPSNNTLWYYRRKLIDGLNKDLKDEEEQINSLLKRNLKIYQIWEHKKWLTIKLNGEYDETEVFSDIILRDEKNFHAWSFYCWYAEKYNKAKWLYDNTSLLLQHDPKNNSAWSARMKALSLGAATVKEDLEFVMNYFKLVSNSESTSNYIRGLLKMDRTIEAEVRKTIEFNLINNQNNFVALSLLAYIELLNDNKEKYNELIEKLAGIDKIRTHFWNTMKYENIKKYE